MTTALTNVTLRVELGLGSGPLVESPTWTDITEYVVSFKSKRGRSTVLDRFDAGSGGILLNNHDGRFDPINTSGPYTPDLKIRVPVRVQVDHSVTTYTLFRGMVEAWPITYSQAGLLSEVELPIVDLTRVLAGASLEGFSYSEQSTGERIDEVLDDVGWPAGLRSIATGVAYVSAGDPGGKALDHIHEVVAVEAGHFFIAADGTATFLDRVSATGLASGAVFGENAGDVRYESLVRANDDDHLFNVVEATRPEGITQIASDATSITANGPSTLTVDAPFVDDNGALNVAEWQVLRLADTVDRVVGLTVNPDYDEANMWPTVAGTELRDGVTVEFQPPGGGTAVNQLSSVEAIEHDWNARDGLWKATFGVWPLAASETDAYWILGTSDDLGTDTILA
jgi:hypothetical protein